jgi:DNA-binding HxlR family transcriptional regulator
MTENKMSEAGQTLAGCPLDPVLSFLALKWLVHIVWLLGQRPTLRFAELQRQLEGVSAKVLSGRLKQLEAMEIIVRDDKGTSPPHVSYRLTRYGLAINDFLASTEQRARQLPLPDIAASSEQG